LIAGKARFRGARKIERAVGYRIPDSAFHPAFLEAITAHMNFDQLDATLRTQILQFLHDFLRCECRDRPLCGCPEKKFTRRIIELREEGYDHHQISSLLLDEYGIDLYPADILSFLEDSVHILEAIEDIARLQGELAVVKDTEKHIREIVR
jgi:Superfamily II helicase, archaea-specific